MNAHTPIPDPTPSAPDDWARPLIERQLVMLGRLAEAGLEIAVALERQATGKADADASLVAQGDIGLAYARVARAVRMTIAQQSKVIETLLALETGAVQAEDEARFDLEEERKARVQRVALRIAKAETDDEQTIDRLTDESAERLDDEDLYGDILARPFSEIVADICRDLGLHPDWAKLAQEPWAREEIESGEAGAPLAAFSRTVPTLRPSSDRRRLKPGAGPPNSVDIFRPPI